MSKHTKILCTLGPSTNSVEKISQLIEAGMNIARLNFSHGTHEDHLARMQMVREAAAKTGKTVGILMDLQGPKIRIGDLENGGFPLTKGDHLRITTEPVLGTKEVVSTSYRAIVKDVQIGNRILIDDGLIEIKVIDKSATEIVTEVIVGGFLKPKKGFNLPEVRVSIPAMTEKDIADLKFGLAQGVDFVALSFVQSPWDIDYLRTMIKAEGRDTWIVAKIEKPQAIQYIDEIIDKANAIMVARGDLGIELNTSDVPIVQKIIVQKCNERYKPVIIATQMLESMIENPRPTRAEASDVANAVFDGTDAVMLSGETASGKYPIEAVTTMSQIIRRVEDQENRSLLHSRRSFRRADYVNIDLGEAVAISAVQVAQNINASAIVVMTHSGSTAIKVAKQKPNCPIFAITDNDLVERLMSMVWGVETILTETLTSTDESFAVIEQLLIKNNLVKEGDKVVFTMGIPVLKHGTTDTIKVSRIGMK
ncbi:MAG: pyruvate kinase [Chloroherpetonaceae bacterium]|nr:pyruvate kinase [Chloroherpetonaceae bacterium]